MGGVARLTLPEWQRALQGNKTLHLEFQRLLGPPVFVAVENLNYNVTLEQPFMAMPNDSGFKKLWTWFARLVQFQIGIPVNKLNRVTVPSNLFFVLLPLKLLSFPPHLPATVLFAYSHLR